MAGRHDFVRPRGALAPTSCPREAVREAAAAALADDWEKALSYGTGIGHPGLCQWVAERHGGLDAGQVMIANGSLEAGWMLFEHLLEPGDRVVVEQPTYDRTLLMLQRLGVELVPVPLRGRRARRRAVRGGARRGADQARPRHPQLPQPGRLHALGREARAAGRARRRARLLDLRGRPLPRAALRGRGAGDDALDRLGRTGRPRLVLLEDGQPGRSRRLPRRPGGRDRASSPSGPTRPTSRPTCWPSRSCSSSAAPAASTATSSSSRAPCGIAATRWSGRCASRSPRPSSSSPAAATSSGSTSPRAPTPRPCWPRRRARASPSSPAPTS